ncbi:MAG: response regulator transcription factor [Actinomycetia bacterium]|nr:response regulator transcription factor [Actinomycetes bacterium]
MESILIVEDDPTIREVLEYNLKNEGYLITTAKDGQEGLNEAISSRPDLILLDLLLPKLDGLSVCRKLRRVNSDVRIIMITALGTSSDKVKGLADGADDYITKPFDFAELLARIRAHLRRKSNGDADHEIIKFGDVAIDPVKHEVVVVGQAVKVRPKEWQLLVTLASNPGVLFSRQQLTSLIWGNDFLGSSRTVDVHIQRLRKKVEENSQYNFIHTIHGLGYRFELTTKGLQE